MILSISENRDDAEMAADLAAQIASWRAKSVQQPAVVRAVIVFSERELVAFKVDGEVVPDGTPGS